MIAVGRARPAVGGERARGPAKARPPRREAGAAGSATLPVLALSAALAVLVAAAGTAEARYIHSTYRFSPGDLGEASLDAAGAAPAQPELSRRQDFDPEGDDDDSDADQSPAASYRNQDDAGDSGGGGDNYGDNESDGPYEESPVEQEGQADLERFFDDHLGASDREGMDKENLPTNLVALLSAPPQLAASRGGQAHFHVPAVLPRAQPPAALTVVPLAPVVNPTVQPRASLAPHENSDPLSSLPTIQTSFIRLPDEKKMIITHRVTARNSDPGSSLQPPSPPPSPPPPPRPLKFLTNAPEGDPAGLDRRDPAASRMAALVDEAATDWQLASQLRIAPTEALTSAPVGKPDPNPATGASSHSDVFADEDDDDDRVYVTNETNRPFRIDALGGFDPEEDFIDAAKELEVVATDEVSTRGAATASGNPSKPSGPTGSGANGTDAAPTRRTHEQGQTPPVLAQEVSFNDPGASETDEVTFGQDDPYQTDLEAEMRQQEYDKLSGRSLVQPIYEQPNPSGSSNVVVDNGNPTTKARDSTATSALTESAEDEDEIDAELDQEYRPEPTTQQQESMAAAAAAAAATRSRAGGGQARGETDDEGAWVNDGVDEMDIPSQSHQNSVLDKAEQREEAARRAADEVASNKNKQEPEGAPSGDNLAGENGPANDNNEESVRMPNADYLKNDFVEDDSGYAS